jgi:hypothetical protein
MKPWLGYPGSSDWRRDIVGSDLVGVDISDPKSITLVVLYRFKRVHPTWSSQASRYGKTLAKLSHMFLASQSPSQLRSQGYEAVQLSLTNPFLDK